MISIVVAHRIHARQVHRMHKRSVQVKEEAGGIGFSGRPAGHMRRKCIHVARTHWLTTLAASSLKRRPHSVITTSSPHLHTHSRSPCFTNTTGRRGRKNSAGGHLRADRSCEGRLERQHGRRRRCRRRRHGRSTRWNRRRRVSSHREHEPREEQCATDIERLTDKVQCNDAKSRGDRRSSSSSSSDGRRCRRRARRNGRGQGELDLVAEEDETHV